MRQVIVTLFLMGVLCADQSSAQGKFSGYMFGDYFYNVARDSAFNTTGLPNAADATKGVKDFQGFQIRRIYFAYDNQISEKFSSRLRVEADQGDIFGSGKIGLAIKDAYLQWKDVFEGSNLIFGISPTPSFDVSEGIWGYRFIEKTIMDLRGIDPSRDFGIALNGKLDNEGTINYRLMIANGSGNKPETDKYKRFYAMLHFKPTKQVVITLNGDYKAAASINDPASTSNPPATISNSTVTGSLFASYKEPDKYTFGFEGFLQSTQNGYHDPTSTSPDLTSRSAIGFSIYASVNFNPDLALVGRYDLFDPNSNSGSKGDSRNLIIGGLSWKPDKNVSISPNVEVETYEKAPSPSTRTFDASVTGRLTFYYVFL
jgi:hypothetical protein